MKINDIRQYGAISNYKKNNESKTVASSSKKNARTDEVQISSEAKLLAQQYATPVTNEERAEVIKRLKEEIALNNYHVDSELLAERMINFFKTNSI